MRCRRRTRGIPGPRWRWRRSPTCSTGGCSGTTRPTRTGRTATASSSPPATPACSSTPILHLTGYNLSLEELKRFRQWESRTPGHPEHFVTEGVETTTGPLGQGFANGVGFAIADRFLAERYNRPHHEIVDRYVYAICSDGDLMEGLSYEAASIAGHLGLGRLVYFYDDNHITIDGTTALTFTTEDKAKRFEAQGWHVQSIADSEDVDAIERATRAAQAVVGRAVADHRPQPHRLRGAEGGRHRQVARRAARRGGGRGGEEGARARSRQALRRRPTRSTSTWTCARRGSSWEQEWKQRFERWAEAFPGLKEEWDADRTGKPRPGWIEALPEFPAGEEVASRDAGKKVMQALKPFTPTMVGGAADLVESTKTEFEGAGLFSKTHAGRNIPFGIREHAMGSIVNGIGLTDGMLKPYGSTFLIFSDYMRPAVRLSALGHMQSLWVWTHDSVGVGEDGPTHQPVEHHMALRAIPNLWYVRPGDANETSMAWRIAMEREGGPVALALSRQKLETLDRTEVAPAEGALRGAYTLWQSGQRLARRDPARDRVGARRRLRGRALDGRQRPRRLDAVLGALRRAAAGLPRRRDPARRARRASRSRPGSRTAGSAGSARRARRWRSTASARRRPATRC